MMKIRNIIVLGILLIITMFASCREDFDYDLASRKLSFSKDTISVDTVFNFTNSSTRKLVIYNKQNDDVSVPKIYLGRGEDSYFKINVDGASGYYFENVPIRKKDSIFIFIEIAAKEAQADLLYEDEIIFETTDDFQLVKLISWVEKADFYITPEGEEYLELDTENWDNSSSKVIYGNLLIKNELNISSGTQIYFHESGSLTIDENAIFNVNGALGSEVKFRSDRHETRYDSLPNQWNKISLKPNSTSNINYGIIIGGKVGLEVLESKLELKNTKIVNNESYGIFAKNAEITGENVVVNNSNSAALAITMGGSYEFVHSTFANYFNIGAGAGPKYSLYLSNSSIDGSSDSPLIKANFYNSIFYGRAANAVAFSKKEGQTFNYSFDSNIIRNDNKSVMDVSKLIGFKNINTEDPLFIDGGYKANNLKVEDNSPAIGRGNPVYANQVPMDINGTSRTELPTLGAHQK